MDLNVIGGGLAGLVSAIRAAELGASVDLYEAAGRLGGRGRATPGAYTAHDGPHVIYADGAMWRWLRRQSLIGPCRTASATDLAERATALGVRIHLDSRVDMLPNGPTIVATSPPAARRLLRDPSLSWDSGSTLLLDVAVQRRRGDTFIVSDLDEAGWCDDSPRSWTLQHPMRRSGRCGVGRARHTTDRRCRPSRPHLARPTSHRPRRRRLSRR